MTKKNLPIGELNAGLHITGENLFHHEGLFCQNDCIDRKLGSIPE